MTQELEAIRPTVLDYVLRPVTLADLDEVVALMNACADVQEGNGHTSATELGAEWEILDLGNSARVAILPDGRMAGYLEVWDTNPMPVNNWVWARVHPDFEGNGIGSTLLDWAEDRLQQAVARVPEDLQVAYNCGVLDWYTPAKQLMEDRGMRLNRYFWRMVVDFEGPPLTPSWPTGLRLSSVAERGDLMAVYRAQEDAFRDHWGHVDQPEVEGFAQWRKWSEMPGYDPSLWFLAMDGEEIAGIALCRRDLNEDPDMGWVSTLGVREPWRKRGLGLALLQHAFGVFYREGKLRVGLGVDATSITGATRLYERAGMHVARRYDNYEKVLRPGRDIARRA